MEQFMKLHDVITESIHDRGIFKVVFMGGLPGAGKSTIIQHIIDGAVQPRLVNTDRSYEFLLKKTGVKASDSAWEMLGGASKNINQESLYHYLNGMLPMFVDSTASNPAALIRRKGIVESLGYDSMMIWVDVDLEVAIERTQRRARTVDIDHIQNVYYAVQANKQIAQSQYGGNFVIIDNNDVPDIGSIEGVVDKFFTTPVSNPIGMQVVEDGYVYLVPDVHSKEHIQRLVSVWYAK